MLNATKKHLLRVTALCAFTFFISGCGANSNTSNNSSDNSTQNSENTNVGTTQTTSSGETSYNKRIGFQLDEPQIDEEIAVMDIENYGKIYIRFFPDECPKTVENFKTLAKKGYYNGTTFHRVIENFMIQGGDPKGDGTGGESAFGGSFEDEFSDNLFNITGALSMANSGPNTNGSQFFINNVDPTDEVYNGTSSDEKVINLYKENGGNSHLDGHHTVFGQVFSGMDIVDKISKIQVDPENDKPVEAVKISNVNIEKYTGDTE